MLTASNVDGSKVSGKVGSAAQADNATQADKAKTLEVTAQKSAKLVASWKGTILDYKAPNDGNGLTIIDANNLRVKINVADGNQRLVALRFNVKVGSIYHLVFSETAPLINGTVTRVTITSDLKYVEADLNCPGHGLSGSGTGVNVMAITYSAYGCYFEGTMSSVVGKHWPDSQYAYVLKMNSPTNDATFNLSGSSQDAIWVSDVNTWYLNPAQPVVTVGAMISPDRLNFFTADTDSPSRMPSNIVTAQIWDIV